MEEASGYMFKIVCELEAAHLKKNKQKNILATVTLLHLVNERSKLHC